MAIAKAFVKSTLTKTLTLVCFFFREGLVWMVSISQRIVIDTIN